MSHLFWLLEDQVDRIKSFFPKERGVGRADDRKGHCQRKMYWQVKLLPASDIMPPVDAIQPLRRHAGV